MTLVVNIMVGEGGPRGIARAAQAISASGDSIVALPHSPSVHRLNKAVEKALERLIADAEKSGAGQEALRQFIIAEEQYAHRGARTALVDLLRTKHPNLVLVATHAAVKPSLLSSYRLWSASWELAELAEAQAPLVRACSEPQAADASVAHPATYEITVLTDAAFERVSSVSSELEPLSSDEGFDLLHRIESTLPCPAFATEALFVPLDFFLNRRQQLRTSAGG